MTEYKTWLEAIEADFPNNAWTREALVNEAQRTHFIGPLPAGFGFLHGAIIDLGFERLGLPPEDLARMRLAFAGSEPQV